MDYEAKQVVSEGLWPSRGSGWYDGAPGSGRRGRWVAGSGRLEWGFRVERPQPVRVIYSTDPAKWDDE
jgi:hypothetical protein